MLSLGFTNHVAVTKYVASKKYLADDISYDNLDVFGLREASVSDIPLFYCEPDFTTKCVIFHVGTNDLTKPTDIICKHYTLLLKLARERYPQAQLLVSSILPRRDCTSTSSFFV